MTMRADVRTQLLDALRLDVFGPRPGFVPHTGYAEETFSSAPSKRYLNGILVHYETPASQRADDTADNSFVQVGRVLEADDVVTLKQASAHEAFLPSSAFRPIRNALNVCHILPCYDATPPKQMRYVPWWARSAPREPG